ncbi:hypothetical protein H6P81_014660 [Aristolochia fimbriata]|uniref:Uncharacterized protein n=1 Tax=Aristolochia fimbriata TaxID=158543 RepID=A0AAV7E5A2_ARIFI|nr:hypothetical protein H6P81_014660 [Aristolochia fimbriata]
MPVENGQEIAPETVPTSKSNSVFIDANRLRRLLDSNEKENRWDKCSIYRVPCHLLLRNEKAYKPNLVSIGPIHHGEPQLSPMEEHKYRALSQFLKRSKKNVDDFKASMKDCVQQLMESYEKLDEEWLDEDKFLELMVLDGCFVLEILRVFTFDKSLGYSPNDPIFGARGTSTVINILVQEIVMLENQLPFLVLEKLLAVENRISTDSGKYLNDLLSIVGDDICTKDKPAAFSRLHIVDFLRNKIIGTPSENNRPEIDTIGIESATEYKKAGIAFAENDSNFLSDIKLENNILRLPVFEQCTFSEVIWFNVWAFECLHAGLTKDISAYICVMARLLRSTDDVAILHSNGLISVTTFGENQEVVELFKSLYNCIDFRVRGDLLYVIMEVNAYHTRSTKKWKRRIREWSLHLKLTYFRSPWTVLSLFAATLLIGLTVWQTVYTTLSYYNPRS